MAGGTPLLFYHFTSYDNGAGVGMLQKYASSQDLAHEVWEVYGEDLIKEGHGKSSHNLSWSFGKYENGEPISKEARCTYRDSLELQKAFPNPYRLIEPSFLSWWRLNKSSTSDIKIHSKYEDLYRRLIKFIKSISLRR